MKQNKNKRWSFLFGLMMVMLLCSPRAEAQEGAALVWDRAVGCLDTRDKLYLEEIGDEDCIRRDLYRPDAGRWPKCASKETGDQIVQKMY